MSCPERIPLQCIRGVKKLTLVDSRIEEGPNATARQVHGRGLTCFLLYKGDLQSYPFHSGGVPTLERYTVSTATCTCGDVYRSRTGTGAYPPFFSRWDSLLIVAK